ncbi:MAG TPA: avidin/streptavidin family protein [Bradyrhizobium sp.]|nr:avidin/streptavidin family protein [Bradyrhizobium sp.]
MKKLLLAFCVLIGFSGAGFADPLTAPSLWRNQRGSELRITAVGNNGSLRGTFTNYAPGYQCQGIPYPIVGTTSPGPTTFTVNFVQCRTVTKWNGTASGFGMPTEWVLYYNGQTQTGSDFFFRVN